MNDLGRLFLDAARRELVDEHLPTIGACLQSLDEDDLWWRPNDASNAVGNLLLHLRGNVAQWLVGGVGGRPFERDRPHEFGAREAPGKDALLERLAATVREAAEVLAASDASTLAREIEVQGRRLTVLEAVQHAVTHFALHTGQIVYVTKARLGRAPWAE